MACRNQQRLWRDGQLPRGNPLRAEPCNNAVFHGTQTGPGGPGEPTGNTVAADYVYAMQFDGDRIGHMTKIWNDTISLQQLGWA